MPRSESDPLAALRQLPSVEKLTRDERLADLPRALVLREARRLLDELRSALAGGGAAATAAADRLAGAVAELRARCQAAMRPRHRRVFNATGIVLHTGIGRAPLPQQAVDAIVAAAGSAVVEVDPLTGERDQRELGVAALLRDLTGAEGALVVNNNAAATMIMLAALTAGREVVVSRGELVEIGGGFRMPDVMARAGCRMVEVGTTNRTWLRDFEQAITPETCALLKVHPSNYRLQGFHGTPSLTELVGLGRARGVMVMEDLGSGLLWQPDLPGLADEPKVADSLAAQPDILCFSGDKLLGGPKCGILLGSKAVVARVRSHPLYRAMRCDKLTLAALEATLRIYRDGDPLVEIPTLRMLSAKPQELQVRSQQLADLLPGSTVVASESFAGSGANPARPLPSFATALRGGDALCDRLRAVDGVPVFARVADGRVLFDARTLLPEDLGAVADAIRRAGA